MVILVYLIANLVVYIWIYDGVMDIQLQFKYSSHVQQMTLNRYEKTILRILLKNGNEMEKEKLLHSFPDLKLRQAGDGLHHLVQLGFVTLKYVSGRSIVVLPRIAELEALKIVDPNYVSSESGSNKRELISKSYIPEPFHVFYGEKEIHKTVSEYWLCRKRKDKEFIGCFIFNADGSKSSISIGRISDRDSLVSKYLFEINRLFNGRVFHKREIKNKFPKALTGNRQPIKAVTEYLCLEGYLERIGNTSKFKRTNKPHIVDTLETPEIRKKEVPKSIGIMHRNGKPTYYFDEELGLYPNFYSA